MRPKKRSMYTRTFPSSRVGSGNETITQFDQLIRSIGVSVSLVTKVKLNFRGLSMYVIILITTTTTLVFFLNSHVLFALLHVNFLQ